MARPLREARALCRWSGIRTWSLLAAIALPICGGCESAAHQPTSVLFALPGAPDQDLFELPYPNDLRRRDDGTISLAGLASGHAPLLQRYVERVAANKEGGFSTNGAVFFRTNQPIDPRSLPLTAGATLANDAAVYLINIDERSNDYGQRTPVEAFFRPSPIRYLGSNSLALLPLPGFPLRPSTVYAAVITDGIVDTHGQALVPSPVFRRVMRSGSIEPRYAKAQAVYQPLAAFIERQGLTNIVAAAVFTTGDPLRYARKLRQAARDLPPPTLNELVISGEDQQSYQLQGSYQTPIIQQGTPPFAREGGSIALTVTGAPTVTGTQKVRLAITTPKGQAPAGGWPVVIYAHGEGGDYRSFIRNGVARTLGSVPAGSSEAVARFALVSIDQPLHGERAGAAEGGAALFFNIDNPEATIGNALQASFDSFVLVRLLAALELGRLAWSEESGRDGRVDFGGVRFDHSRILALGHAQGASILAPLLAYEPDIKAAVLSAGRAVTMLSLLTESATSGEKSPLEAAIGEPLDRHHPMLSLVQHALEPADPANYAPLILRRSPNGGPKHLLLTQGHDDHVSPSSSTEALAIAAGVPPAGQRFEANDGFPLAGLTPIALPTAGNLSGANRTISAGLVQFRGLALGTSCANASDCGDDSRVYCDTSTELGVCRRDGHFVLFDLATAQRQYSYFLATAVRDGLPSLVAPQP